MIEQLDVCPADDVQEDKSSSLDLNALYDQSSSGIPLDGSNEPNTVDSIDNLLANLAEDNANSLPSDNEEFHRQNIQIDSIGQQQSPAEENSETSSLQAIAEDVPNGCSQQTKDDELDAEMVSEDELPAPTQPKVDDAEEVSDEELPGPKRAELPADTEVVSEDELPSLNKSKRKAEEGQDLSTADKRPRTDDNGN